MSRILVIEDDPAILRGLADNLKFESHEVLTAADGTAHGNGQRPEGETYPVPGKASRWSGSGQQ